MAVYNRMTYKGYRVLVDTTASGAHKLHGLRDTVIYVTYSAYNRMSAEFKRVCDERCIEVKILQ